MPPHIYEDVVLNGGDGIPFRSIQTTSRAGSTLHLALLSALAAIVVLPQLAVAAYALLTPAVRTTILAQPMVSFQLLAALVFWIALFVWPLKNLVLRLSAGRTVEIVAGNVIVTERRPFARVARWTQPLNAYRGIAHNVRSSLSGTRHEVILVHPDRRRSVLLHATSAAASPDIERISRSLDLPEIPAQELYALAKIRIPLLGTPATNPLPA